MISGRDRVRYFSEVRPDLLIRTSLFLLHHFYNKIKTSTPSAVTRRTGGGSSSFIMLFGISLRVAACINHHRNTRIFVSNCSHRLPSRLRTEGL